MEIQTKTVALMGFEAELWDTAKMASLAKGMTLKRYVANALRASLQAENLTALANRKVRKPRKYDRKATVKAAPVEVAAEVPQESVEAAPEVLEGLSGCCGVALTSWLGTGKCVGCGKVWK